MRRSVQSAVRPVRKALANDFGTSRVDAIRAREQTHGPCPKANLDHVVNHIEYIANRIGIKHLGIGSDFFGVPTTPVGLEDVSRFPFLIAELLRRGWSDKSVIGVAGGNFLRVFREVEDKGEQLRETQQAAVGTIKDFDGADAPY